MIEELKPIGQVEKPAEIINLNDYLVSPDEDIPEPTPILSIKEFGRKIPIFTEDNVSMIFGPAKSRKSALIRSICQTVLSGENEKMYSSYYSNNIAVFDTEQSRFHCLRSTRLIWNMTQQAINYFCISTLNKDQKKKIVEDFLIQNPDCGLVILDNIVHFVGDFNSAQESSEVTEWVLNMKSKYKTHILVVLHENASSGFIKPRGHLGTNLMNLCETAIRIQKDPNDKFQSIVSAALTRGRSFEDFALTMDDQMIPYLSDLSPYEKENFKL